MVAFGRGAIAVSEADRSAPGGPPIRILQGPQNPERRIGAAVHDVLPDGPVAVVSAGWQEAEGDLDELAAHVGRPLRDLSLYQRADLLFRSEPAMREAHRARQDQLVALQRLYRLRLHHLALAARAMLETATEPELVTGELRHAVSQLRALDRHHLHRTEEIHQTFVEHYELAEHPLVAEQRAAIREELASCSGVILTGGNVLVLLNRLRLFGVDALLATMPVIAWSAGAMVLAERVVLYHDRAPGGRREPELMGTGLGLLPGYVFLPDARRRLLAKDRARIGLAARRFAPARCVALDNGSELRFGASFLTAARDTRCLQRDGALALLEAP